MSSFTRRCEYGFHGELPEHMELTLLPTRFWFSMRVYQTLPVAQTLPNVLFATNGWEEAAG